MFLKASKRGSDMTKFPVWQISLAATQKKEWKETRGQKARPEAVAEVWMRREGALDEVVLWDAEK